MKSSRLAVPFLLLALFGCSGAEGQKSVYPVTGKVTLGGAPIAKATVIFTPIEKDEGIVATGITDNKGVYQLTTYDSYDGAAEGKYEVTVSKSAAPAAAAAPAHSVDASGAPPVHDAAASEEEAGATTIDPKWSKPGNGLEAEVQSSGDNTFDFKLD